MSQEFKSVLFRFLRVFVSGAIGQMAVTAALTSDLNSMGDFGSWAIAILVGGTAGGLAALDKALRME